MPVVAAPVPAPVAASVPAPVAAPSAAPKPPPSAPVPAAPATSPSADERIRRYEQALTDPTVRDLIKRFEADILAREPGDKTAWMERLKRS